MNFCDELFKAVHRCTLSHNFTYHAPPSSLHCHILQLYYRIFERATTVNEGSCANHYTLTTPITINNTHILKYVNGNNKSASNNQTLSATNQINLTFKLLFNFWVYALLITLIPTCQFKNSICVIAFSSFVVYYYLGGLLI